MTVSTRKELRAVAERMDWQVVAEYIDHGISGAKGRDQRPAYDRLYSAIVRREIDLVMAWSVDRLAGKAMFQICGVFAEFQCAMIRERVKAGLERARAQGKTLGRPRTPEIIENRIRAARRQGKGIKKIANELGIGVSTVQRVVHEPSPRGE